MAEKTIFADNTTETINYITSPEGLIAIEVIANAGNREWYWVFTDHLGSITTLLHEGDGQKFEMSYDAWGMRRDPATFEVFAIVPPGGTAYGFTGHEHLDLFMLVNMDGRMYDPVIGRFLSPDPVLQFPNYTQGLNPYSYALNNPLRFVDPNGYSLVGQLFALTASVAASFIPGVNFLVPILVHTVVMTIDHAIELGRSANFANIMGYFTYTFVMTTITQGVTKSIGDYYDYVKNRSLVELRRALAHGTLNGAMRMAQGGKFEHGFLSGFVSSLGGSYVNANGGNMSSVEKIAISAVIGGTAEALGGGKFANGAVTGAYVMALNHLGGKWSEPGNPTIFIKRLCIPAGFNTEEYINLLKEELVKNGFSKDLVVELYSFKGALKAWFNNSPTGTVTIKNFRLGQDRINAGGYATLYNEDSIVVYNGLSMTPSNSVVPTWEYVNATMHEIGHAFFGFYHDKFGFTNDPSSVMDVRGAYTKGAGFNTGQQNIIKKAYGVTNKGIVCKTYINYRFDIFFLLFSFKR